jgi:DNA-directed RNA polymerase specialized sigma24 family protein
MRHQQYEARRQFLDAGSMLYARAEDSPGMRFLFKKFNWSRVPKSGYLEKKGINTRHFYDVLCGRLPSDQEYARNVAMKLNVSVEQLFPKNIYPWLHVSESVLDSSILDFRGSLETLLRSPIADFPDETLSEDSDLPDEDIRCEVALKFKQRHATRSWQRAFDAYQKDARESERYANASLRLVKSILLRDAPQYRADRDLQAEMLVALFEFVNNDSTLKKSTFITISLRNWLSDKIRLLARKPTELSLDQDVILDQDGSIEEESDESASSLRFSLSELIADFQNQPLSEFIDEFRKQLNEICLSETYFNVIRLRYDGQNRSMSDIARELGIPLKQANSRLKAATEQLRQKVSCLIGGKVRIDKYWVGLYVKGPLTNEWPL